MTSYLKALTMGFPAGLGLRESAVHHLGPDDLGVLSVGAAAMAGRRWPAQAGCPGGATITVPARRGAPFMI